MQILSWVNNKYVRNFEGFTLQTGFYFGFIIHKNAQIPFVWNGKIHDDDFIIPWIAQTDETWKQVLITKKSNLKIFNGITFRSKNNKIPTQKANALELEQMKIKELRADGKDTSLFSTNFVTSKRQAKPHNKQITDYRREFLYALGMR